MAGALGLGHAVQLAPHDWRKFLSPSWRPADASEKFYKPHESVNGVKSCNRNEN
jgi:hypothetical protein